MKISEQLKAAKALISDPSKWIKGEYAEDSEGNSVEPEAWYACKFCSLGAIRHANNYETDYTDPVHFLEQALKIDVPAWNDRATHEEIMVGFDKAITIAESEGE